MNFTIDVTEKIIDDSGTDFFWYCLSWTLR